VITHAELSQKWYVDIYIKSCCSLVSISHLDLKHHYMLYYIKLLVQFSILHWCYRLDGPGIESRWGRDFPHQSRPALGPTQPPVQWVPVSFPGVKRPGRGVDQPPSSSARVKERVELYLYSPSGPSWPVLRRTLLYVYFTLITTREVELFNMSVIVLECTESRQLWLCLGSWTWSESGWVVTLLTWI
jgi:hypothetical protein